MQLSGIKEAIRTFVIFPAGWNNEQGWVKIFDSIAEIVGQAPIEPVLQLRERNWQVLKCKSFGVDLAPRHHHQEVALSVVSLVNQQAFSAPTLVLCHLIL